MEKSKLQLYLPPDDYIFIYNYAVNKGKKNFSQAISQILTEYKRFKAIAMKLQQQIEDGPKLDVSGIVKEIEDGNIKARGVKLDKNKNK